MRVDGTNYIHRIECKYCHNIFKYDLQSNEVTFGGKTISFKGKEFPENKPLDLECPYCHNVNHIIRNK